MQERMLQLRDDAREIAASQAPDGFFILFARFVDEAAHKRVLGDVLIDRTENRALVEELFAIYAELIRRGQDAGLIRSGIDVTDVRALLAGAHGALGIIGDDPARRQTLKDTLLAGLRI
jgi:hypothetical protein